VARGDISGEGRDGYAVCAARGIGAEPRVACRVGVNRPVKGVAAAPDRFPFGRPAVTWGDPGRGLLPMARGLYILIAVLGLLLIVTAGVSAVASFASPGWDRAFTVGEVLAAAVGVGMVAGGMVQARNASEFDVRVKGGGRSRRAPAVPVVAVPEVSFECPGCGRTYRAAGGMAGRPFACRVCDERFTVPRPAVV
jgi:hypothetical protein